jgi:hypothetical protein
MPSPPVPTNEELLALIQGARWFGAKGKALDSAEIVDRPVEDSVVTLAIVEVRFSTGTHEHYLVDIAADGAVDALERPEVATRLAALTPGPAAGLVADVAGPRTYRIDELVDSYLQKRGLRRPMVHVPLPGRAARAVRQGAVLAPERAVGRRTWEEFLAERVR